jgi:hypothetical protein
MTNDWLPMESAPEQRAVLVWVEDAHPSTFGCVTPGPYRAILSAGMWFFCAPGYMAGSRAHGNVRLLGWQPVGEGPTTTVAVEDDEAPLPQVPPPTAAQLAIELHEAGTQLVNAAELLRVKGALLVHVNRAKRAGAWALANAAAALGTTAAPLIKRFYGD